MIWKEIGEETKILICEKPLATLILLLLIDHVIVTNQKFSMSLALLLKRKLQDVGHKWVTSGLLYGSVGQVGQQV